MATQAQIQANRANARRSTGPRSAKGKAASASNALKHGLRAQRTVLPGEDLAEFHALVADLQHELQPATTIERALVYQLADAEWRLRRIPLFEAGVLDHLLEGARQHCDTFPDLLPADPALAESYLLGEAVTRDAVRGDALTKLSQGQARLSQRYFKALDHLYRAQDRRRQASARSLAKTAGDCQTNPIPAQPAAVNGAATTLPLGAETSGPKTNPAKPASAPAPNNSQPQVIQPWPDKGQFDQTNPMSALLSTPRPENKPNHLERATPASQPKKF